MISRSFRARRFCALPLAGLVLLAGCGGDDEKKTAVTDDTPTAAAAAEGNTFEVSDVGFTFSYPDGFEQLDEPNDGKVVAAVTPTPTDPKNGLKVRKTAETELAFDSYGEKIHAQFEDQLAVDVAMREETLGEREVGVMDWSKEFTYQEFGEEATTQLKSTSYFFAAGGKTWQLECISATEQRELIDAACEQALGSIEG